MTNYSITKYFFGSLFGVDVTSEHEAYVSGTAVLYGTTIEAGGYEFVNNGATAGAFGGGEGASSSANATTINGGILELQSGALLGANIFFAPGSAGGLLMIDGSTTPSLTSSAVHQNYAIYGFSPNNTIDLAFLRYDSTTTAVFGSGNVLNITATTPNPATYELLLEGSDFTNETFLLSPDGESGTDITLDPPGCFLRSTRIATERGDVHVEDLRVGDVALTAAGERRPIVWIGHRDMELVRHPWPLEVWPVRVRAHAFAPDTPRRDLWLSPQHAVFVDGVLIPILQLANGATIVQERADRVSYWHVELETHDVLLAEGLPAESFMDCGSRSHFANGGEIVALHPNFALKNRDEACAPFRDDGPEVSAAQARLRERAQALGFERADDPHLRIAADGVILAPISVENARYRFALPDGVRRAQLVSRHWRPADEGEADVRFLGVAVAGVDIDGSAVDLATLGAGWYALERDGERSWIWNDGAADLPVGRQVEIALFSTGRYWRQPLTGFAAQAA